MLLTSLSTNISMFPSPMLVLRLAIMPLTHLIILLPNLPADTTTPVTAYGYTTERNSGLLALDMRARVRVCL